MHASRDTTTHDADQVFTTRTEITSAWPYTQVDRDDASRTIRSTRGKTPFSRGHEYVAPVIPTDGGASVEVTAGGFDDRPRRRSTTAARTSRGQRRSSRRSAAEPQRLHTQSGHRCRVRHVRARRGFGSRIRLVPGL